MKKVPSERAKQGLYAFLIFAGIFFGVRHCIHDKKMEERVVLLEAEMIQLNKNLASSSIQPTEVTDAAEDTHKTQSRPSTRQNPRHQPVGPSKANETLQQQEGHISTKEWAEKFATPILIELNTADSAILVRIPGIGAQTAHAIVRYRERLGGFYSPQQLAEELTWESAQNHLNEWISDWMKADTSHIRKLDINTLSFKELLRHPYLDYEQVKTIVRYREKHKGIRSIKELEQLENFGQEDIARLKYYLDFRGCE